MGTPVAVLIDGPDHGSLSFGSDGAFVYTPELDFDGIDSFSYEVSNGDVVSSQAMVSIVVAPVNDPPVNVVPSAQTTREDSYLRIEGVLFTDIDAGPSDVNVVLTVEHGGLTVVYEEFLFLGSSLEVVGNGTDVIGMTGPLDAINSILSAGLWYEPAPNWDGGDTLTITTDDQGSSGIGPALSDIDTVAITVTAVTDRPVIDLWDAVAVEPATVALDISVGLADTDGSESLAITIGGVPAEAVLSAGTDLGGGLFQLTTDELIGLTVTLRDDAVFDLTVTATSTESSSGESQSVSDVLNVRIDNLPPILVQTGLDAADIVEGGTVQLTGSYTEPGPLDTHTVLVEWGDGDTSNAIVDPVTQTFSAQHQYMDDPAGSLDRYPIYVTLSDDDDGSAMSTLEVTVQNVAPSFEAGDDVTLPPEVLGVFNRTSIRIEDPGADVWTGTVNWGDSLSNENLTVSAKSFGLQHMYNDEGTYTVTVTVEDGDPGGTCTDTFEVTVIFNRPPNIAQQSFDLDENQTAAGIVIASDPDLPNDSLSYGISGGPDEDLFTVDSTTGALTFKGAPDFEMPGDANGNNVYEVAITVTDSKGASDMASVTVNVLNLASISGVVFVDVNSDGLMQANEPGIDGVTIELQDGGGNQVSDGGTPVTATTSDGGFYLFDDLAPAIYQLHEVQPSGVDDGAELLGSLEGDSIPSNDTMRLPLARIDATDYLFAELGQEVTSGDTATIGFWQNKHGQQLIGQGGTNLALWLTDNFGNVFGDTFSDNSGTNDGLEVAAFFKDQLFRQKSKKSAGPAKVDAQFMAVALATYFTSSNLAGDVAAGYGFNVTQTGIGTKVVNVRDNGAAFGELDGTDLTIMQLLWATNNLTDNIADGNLSGFADIYDTDGDGVIDAAEAALRAMANDVYSAINEQGDI